MYGDGLSAATVRRLACDARIIPLVLGTNSEPLDVGRSERLVTRAMRRALNARDQGCVICGVPPIMCDAHHLRSWIDGGETKTSNLVLLCRRHHVDLHHGQWSVTITDCLVEVARPSWAEPSPRQHRSRHRRRADHPAGDPVVAITQRSRTKADEAEGSRSRADETRRSRWKADEAVLRQAADFALADVPAG
ncbi:HNH endonuclease [Kribbella sp. VKM Ac-2566]|uniref:HNH endonuclease n=1 Tax=Kribbella sp. VKM Ac-2566 TaxID=2512218 RepID=UPI001EDF77AA|nr:HNH endonuclease signature motif containing protein [Kribbella sp. VKM Ac-2566]